MPWFFVDGESVYERLRQPGFHLLVFTDGRTDIPPLPADLMAAWDGKIDSTVISLTPEISKIFGTDKAFYLILRPDNYIGIISDNFSGDAVREYLAKFTK